MVIIFLIMRAVVLAWKLNGSNVTAARSYSWDIHPALSQLIPPGTHGIVPGINGLTVLQQRKMSVAWCAVFASWFLDWF